MLNTLCFAIILQRPHEHLHHHFIIRSQLFCMLRLRTCINLKITWRKLDLFLVKVNKTVLEFEDKSEVRAYFFWLYFHCNLYENTTIYKVFVCTHVYFNSQSLMLQYFHIVFAFQRDHHYYCTSELFEKTSKCQKSRV